MDENRFRHVWKLLCRTYLQNGHCMSGGCGRETLAFWVRETCGVRVSAQELRQVLAEASRRGWVKAGRNTAGCRTFQLNCGRYRYGRS